MVTWCKRNLERAKLDCLPVIEFVHNAEPQTVHQIANAGGDYNRLVGSDAPQGPSVEMIEMRMRHQDKINRRQVMNFEPGLFQSFDYFEPFRPNRVDQDIHLMRLDQK